VADEPASWWDEIGRRKNWVNKLYYGDNLDILRDRTEELLDGQRLTIPPPLSPYLQAQPHVLQAGQEALGI
jgi:hypothetical protein